MTMAGLWVPKTMIQNGDSRRLVYTTRREHAQSLPVKIRLLRVFVR